MKKDTYIKMKAGERKKRISNKKGSNGNSDSHCFICKRFGRESKTCRYKCTKCRIPNHSQRDCWFQDKKKKE